MKMTANRNSVPGTWTKLCSRCRRRKSISLFSPDRRAADDLQPACRRCVTAAQRRRYWRNPIAARQRQREYYANNTPRVKAINERSRAKHHVKITEGKRKDYQRQKDDPTFKKKRRRYRRTTRAHKQAYDRRYRALNAPRINSVKAICRARRPELYREFRRRNKLKRNGKILNGDAPALIEAWERAQPKSCFWCNIPCEGNHHLDHFDPLSRGGQHVIENLVISCPHCNGSKNGSDPRDFAERLGLDLRVLRKRRQAMIYAARRLRATTTRRIGVGSGHA